MSGICGVRSDVAGKKCVLFFSFFLSTPKMKNKRFLTFNLVSTWGDEDFVALAGIEIFTEEGQVQF